MTTPLKELKRKNKKLLTSREMMGVFASLVTRPQYAQVTNVSAAGDEVRTATEFTVMENVPRLAETDPARLKLATSVMFAVLALYEHELYDRRAPLAPVVDLPGPGGVAH